jgi:acyl-CoA thioesterase-1
MHTHVRRARFILLLFLLVTLPGLAGARTLLVLGDSLSAGYGIPAEQAWVQLLRARLEQKRLDWSVVNASISGETTDGGLRRLPGLLSRHEPGIVVIDSRPRSSNRTWPE